MSETSLQLTLSNRLGRKHQRPEKGPKRRRREVVSICLRTSTADKFRELSADESISLSFAIADLIEKALGD